MLSGLVLLLFVSHTIAKGLDDVGVSDILAKFNQHDYNFTLEHIDAVRFDKKLMKELSVRTFKYNRTCTACNMTVINKIDFGKKIEIVIQGYKFLSNEYRVFPVHFQVNFCKAFNQNMAGIKTMLAQFANYEECPTRKDTVYKITNFLIDEKKLPPYIPNGRYMFEAQMEYLEKELALIQVYATVDRAILPRD